MSANSETPATASSPAPLHAPWRGYVHWWAWFCLPPLALLAASAAALLIDREAILFVRAERMPRLLFEAVVNLEQFGHGMGVLAIAAAIFLLEPARRRGLSRLLFATLGLGMLANGVKLLVERYRPRDLALLQETVWDTFVRAHPGDVREMSSFPSSHTATAVGLAVVLCTWYPRGRWLFPVLAAAVGLSRVFKQAHFPSDVLAGAAFGYALAYCATTISVDPLWVFVDWLRAKRSRPAGAAGTSCPTAPKRRLGRRVTSGVSGTR